MQGHGWGGPSDVQVNRVFHRQATNSLIEEGPQILVPVNWDTVKMFMKPGVAYRG